MKDKWLDSESNAGEEINEVKTGSKARMAIMALLAVTFLIIASALGGYYVAAGATSDKNTEVTSDLAAEKETAELAVGSVTTADNQSNGSSTSGSGASNKNSGNGGKSGGSTSKPKPKPKPATPKPSPKPPVTCNYCKGTGQAQCPDCHATGLQICLTCDGSGIVDGWTIEKLNGVEKAHHYTASCKQCQNGKVKCSTCNGTTQVKCSQCGGLGVTNPD